MTTQYKKFIKLFSKWPIDTSKGERDLGLFIRNRVKIAFENPGGSTVNTETCNQHLEALNRIAENHYLRKHKRIYNSTATGLTTEECSAVLSTETLELLEEENRGFFSKLFDKK